MSNGTYRACDDGDLIDGSCSLLPEQLFGDETADVACAYNGELSKARHDMSWCIDEEVSEVFLWVFLWFLLESWKEGRVFIQ